MSKRRLASDERGAVHLLLFALLAIVAISWIWITSFNWMYQTFAINRIKPALDIATRAAASNRDAQQALQGKLVWDQTNGTSDFYKYLQLNLHLDGANTPTSGSFVTSSSPVVVRDLEFVTLPSYPATLTRSISIYASTTNATTRNVSVTIYGPSVIAIVEVTLQNMGFGNSFPVIIPSVGSIRKR